MSGIPEFEKVYDNVPLLAQQIQRISQTRLRPENLSAEIPDYNKFYQLNPDSLIYCSKEVPMVSGKLVLAIIGTSASGKDAILNLLKELMQFNIPITTTTRSRRNENDQQEFLTQAEFKARLGRREFIEYIQIGDNFYGTSVATMEAAVNDEQTTLLRVDLKGAEAHKEWMRRYHPEVSFVTMFVLRDGTFLDQMHAIIHDRGLDDALENRIPRAVWEIYNAPQIADVFLMNPNDPSGKPQKAAAAALEFIQNLRL